MRRARVITVAAVGLCIMTIGLRAQAPTTARATLKNAQGETVGQAMLTETPHGVLIKTTLTGVPPGVHAFHIHAVGQCEPPFTTAGGHFNPTAKEHGIENPRGMHAGDMPNVDVPADGQLTFERLAEHVTLATGSASLFDADGSALVLHAGADDYTSDPAGNAGARLACGVVTH
jgi:Cu-Zn family superoxide dismutase